MVEVAYDGPHALPLLGERAFEVCVLDIGLPVMDGYEVARRIRELPSSHACHLIAVTGYGQDSDRRRGAAAGFNAFFAKPVPSKS